MTEIHHTPAKSALQRLHNWAIHPPGLALKDDMIQERRAAATGSLEFVVLLIMSSVLATLGLISNSPAVVIGAMIVAPLMDPILSLAFGIAIGHRELILKATALVGLGSGLVIATSAGLTQALSVNFLDEQILSRTSPNLIDMLVAVAAGTVGAFVQSRRSLLNSLAGVAIAVALVPPLCVTGIGLNQSATITARLHQGIVPNLQHHVADGSLLLFITNLLGIGVAGVAVFLIQRYGNLRRCAPYLIGWLLLFALVCMPLSASLKDFTARRNIESNIKQFQLKKIADSSANHGQAQFWENTNIAYINTHFKGDTLNLSLVLEGPSTKGLDAILDSAYRQLKSELKKQGHYRLEVSFGFMPTKMIVFDSSSSQLSRQGE